MISPEPGANPSARGGFQPKLPPGTAFTPGRFAVWAGAVGVLWFVLSALSDSGNGDLARAIAGMLAFGALIVLGPGAIQNAQMMFGGSSHGGS